MAKTLDKVRERFYWAKCRRDVEDWCRSCELCASHKGPSRRFRAPTFERLMEQVLAGLPLSVCLLYLDDILVPGTDFDAAIKGLEVVFDRLLKAFWAENLLLVKCSFV